MHHFVFLFSHYFSPLLPLHFASLKTSKSLKYLHDFVMKKKLFSCFNPLAQESQTDGIHVHPCKKQRTNSGRPFSEVLEILLHKASLKIKVSDRRLSLQTKNARLRRIYRRLQMTGDGEKREDKGAVEAKVSVSDTNVGSLGSSCSSYESGTAAVGQRPSSMPRLFDHEARRVSLMERPCTHSNTNPGLYLLVVTLFFTVVWGRARAVLFALVFLYSFPGWAGFLR